MSQIYPRDEPGTVWNSIQNGLVLARNGDECGSLAASIDCQYFDLLKNIVAIIEKHINSVDVDNKDYNSMDRTETESILEEYLPAGLNMNVLQSFVKSLL